MLLIDDDADEALLVRHRLRSVAPAPIELVVATDRSTAEVALRDHFDVCLLDYRMGSFSGIDLLTDLDLELLPGPIIMLTANSEQDYVINARDKGVTEFLAKPFNVEGLYPRLVAVIAKPRSFVNADEYFGPDRRRRQVEYGGPDRRRAD